ncbi:hypothetical protein G6N74_05220 [Mesorhizobium sp. CGMCC 1.15528]|uniref:Uncharacterized protein n=1 Tax=Mesorhizobium zhangyense TaxID=1776730 RepID=A0A7C9R572_9HYPH|nr:hypothetical protein [Mesorhizobium zhangyense]NGN40457.1 hypothetical protein [Mesorhizobium zhangyense]
MRIQSVFLLGGIFLTGTAQAGSIQHIEAMTVPLGPSMVLEGTATVPAKPAQTGEKISTSVIALGDAMPNVDGAKVAAIPPADPAPKPRHQQAPMVMRGGISGDTFVRGTGVSTPAPTQVAADTPAKPSGPPLAPMAPAK